MKLNWIAIGSASAALAVILGAFGAHGLRDRLTPEELDVWKTAVLYHLFHAVGLILFGLSWDHRKSGSGPGLCLLIGGAVFSGTLYGLALGGPRWLGAITPIGGGLLIVGWIWFAMQSMRRVR